jgi:hypothetical protein
VDAFKDGAFENNGGVLAERFEGGFVIKRKWRNDDADANLKAAACTPFRLQTVGKIPKQVADGREYAFLLDTDRGVPEARSKFQRVDAVVVHDAVHVDVTDVAFFCEIWLHLEQCAIEEGVGLAPEHGRTHFSGGWANFAGKEFFVLEVDVYRSDEFFSIEETADGDFDAVHAALQLEDFDFVGKGALVGFQHSDHIIAIFFFADKQAALDVLGFTAGLDDIAIGIFLNKLNGGIEGIEILVRNDGDAGFFQFFLAEGAVVLKIVGVGATADDRFSGRAEGLCFAALAQRIVKNNDIGPFDVFFVIAGLGDKTVGDVPFLFIFDVIADLVTFFDDLPGNVSDEAGE